MTPLMLLCCNNNNNNLEIVKIILDFEGIKINTQNIYLNNFLFITNT